MVDHIAVPPRLRQKIRVFVRPNTGRKKHVSRVMAELVAENAKGARRVAEAASDFGGGIRIDVQSTQSFVYY